MSMDVIANFCTSIRNAIMIKKRFVDVPYSKYKEQIALAMQSSGFLKGFQVIALNDHAKVLRLLLHYINGTSVISAINTVSKSGCRVYKKAAQLSRVKSGLGISIISTNKGVMTDIQAKNYQENGEKKALGGELVCVMW